jgi:hypothetical protein
LIKKHKKRKTATIRHIKISGYAISSAKFVVELAKPLFLMNSPPHSPSLENRGG